MLRLLGPGFDLGSGGGGGNELGVWTLCTKLRGVPGTGAPRIHYMGPRCVYCRVDTAQYCCYRKITSIAEQVEMVCVGS